MNLYLRLLSYIRPYWTSFSLSLAAMFVVSVGNLIPTIIGGRVVIDQILVDRNVSRLHWVVIILIGVHLVKSIAIMIAEWLSHEIAEHIIFDMRTQIYTHLQKLSYRFHKDNSTGELMSRVVNDIDALRDMLAHSPNMIIVNLFTFIGIGIFLFGENWQLALVAIVPVPFIGLIMVRFGLKLRRIYDDVRAKLGDVNSRLQDNLSGIFEIQSFAREPYEALRFTGQCSDYRASIIRGIRLWMRVSPTVQFALGASWTVILWYGSWQIINGQAGMTIGDLFIFLGFLWRLFIPIEMVSHEIERLQKALAAGARMINLLNVAPEIQERSQAVNREIRGEIVFENVSFKYTNEDVLQEINLKIRAGETIALVGPSGVGKTTLVGLVPRFYDVGGGRVYIDGVDVCSWKLHSLRSQIGLVPQETFLFNGTIHENIAYGKLEATQAEVERAAIAANIYDFILSLPEAFDTRVGERGLRLSGGQKQRVSIARAILKDPPILILDEATSSVDTESEHLIQQSLTGLLRGRTTLIIAHRLATIKSADRIIVLENSRILESGTHVELIARKGLYSRLYNSQFAAA
ncbi:MAG: ABC transporter ATP-binding protein [Candidatus Poribacteria bacterium]|nr:ABC transporter ATP-binding protein [Candidatus Poribacteria bacterium]MDE0505849.1 ABC transporter ATP-binding protein [Candidatus Poribacteria bacterium]